MINYFIGVALAVAPFFVKTGAWTTTAQSQEFFLGMVSIFGVLAFGIKKAHKNILIMSVFLVLFAFTTHNPFGIFQYCQLVMSFCGVAFVALVYSHKDGINQVFIFKILGAVCLIESLWMISQELGVNLHTEIVSLIDSSYRVVPLNEHQMAGSLGNKNHSGALIASTIPFLSPWLWVIPVGVLIMSNSALPVVCLIVSITSFYAYKTRKFAALRVGVIALVTVAVATLLGVFHGTYFSDSNRVTAWTELYNTLGFQLWGKGLGWVPEIFSKKIIAGEKFYQLHNEWIELYAIGGLLSVGVGLYLILPIFKNRDNPKVSACLISLLVNSLGNFTFHIAPLFMVFAYCYAIQLGKEEGLINGLERT